MSRVRARAPHALGTVSAQLLPSRLLARPHCGLGPMGRVVELCPCSQNRDRSKQPASMLRACQTHAVLGQLCDEALHSTRACDARLCKAEATRRLRPLRSQTPMQRTHDAIRNRLHDSKPFNMVSGTSLGAANPTRLQGAF